MISQFLFNSGKAAAALLAFTGALRVGAEETSGQRSAAVTVPEAPAVDVVQQQLDAVLKKFGDAVVRVQATDAHGKIAGTGFFIDPTGVLLTSYSVGGDTHEVTVIMGDRRLPATRLVADERCGIALLKVNHATPFLPLGSTRELHSASMVMTLGYPMDLPLSPSFGIIGGFDRRYLGAWFCTTHLRANVPVQRGEGGAPLLNMKGEVMGVLISTLDNGSACFVLPVEAAQKVQRDYLRFGEVRPGWLGVSLDSAPEPVNGSAVRVQEVFPRAPAQKAGVEPGDIILQVGERRIAQLEDMLDASFFLSATDSVVVQVARGDEELHFEVEVTDPPGRRLLAHPLSDAGEATRLQAPEGLRIGPSKP